MEDYISSAVDFVSSADIYLIALAAVLTALIPVIRKTKTKTDDKIVDSILAGLKKIRSYLPSKKVK